MGTRGPAPKRTRERMGHVTRADKAAVGKVIRPDDVVVPYAPSGLHPIARRLYNSLSKSGQSEFYEASDWELARMAAELTSRMLGEKDTYMAIHWQECKNPKCKCAMPETFNPRQLESVWKLWAGLMVNEPERRRARIEIEHGAPEADTGQSAADKFKLRLAQ